MKRHIIFFFLLFLTRTAFSQQTLCLEEFLQIVRTYHPVAKAAGLNVQIAEADVRAARGGFDPVFQNEISKKEFGGLLYYNQQTTEVKIPTWFGVTISGGIQTLGGSRTDPADTKGNTSFFGFSVPVAKGLLTDERRADLQTAKVYRNLTVEQRRSIVNNLLYEASVAYWDWWQQHQTKRIVAMAATNAEQRFRLVKQAYTLGDRPAIDTIEALALWRSFRVQQSETELNSMNAALALSVFLWQANGQTYTPPETVYPQPDEPAVQAMDITALEAQLPLHPHLRQYEYKTEALQIQKRVKFQYLLPSIYLKYNQLNKTQEVWKTVTTPWLDNDYRYGISIALPLRMSEGRGEYRKAGLKVKQTLLEQDNATVTQRVKLWQYYNEYSQLNKQILLQQEAVSAYAVLQRGEEMRWQNGESSLFIINSREQKKLEMEIKLIDLKAKQGKAKVATLWASGKIVDTKPD